MDKPVVIIENWTIEPWPGGGNVLYGDAKGHPRLGDCPVRTSSIQNIDMATNTVETRNTIYRLVGEAV